MIVCIREGCVNVIPKGRRKYCSHLCNISHLNNMRTPEYCAADWAKNYAKRAAYYRQKAKDYRRLVGREVLNTAHRKWYSNNPEIRKHLNTAYRNRRRLTPFDMQLTLPEWKLIVASFESKCAYCHTHLEGSNLTRDHLIPVSKGGLDTMSNIVPACRRCNGWKRDLDLAEFYALLQSKQIGGTNNQ